MKSVFVVHSHTLLLTSLGTVEALGLDPAATVFVYTRGYRTSFPVNGCREVFADEAFARINPLKRPENRRVIRREIRWFDAWVREQIGDRFELFVPHLWNPFFKLLQTHPDCLRVSFVQEGAFTVEKYFHNHFPLWRKWKIRLGEFLRWGSTRLYGNGWYTDGELRHQDELDAYAVYPAFFQYLDCRLHLVKWPEIATNVPRYEDGPVFVFDGFVTHGYCTRDYYLDACGEMVRKYAGSRNYIKFHPAQESAEREALCGVFSALDVSFEILDDKFPLEASIISGSGMTLVGMGSSLLYFARAFGHTVHCCDTTLLSDPLYRAYHDQGVPLFDEYSLR